MDVVVVFYILDIIDYITSVAVSGYVFDEIVNVKLKKKNQKCMFNVEMFSSLKTVL